ncbi:MAG: hypothetical protein KKD39_04575 [Candidatus Altiarchaeota archaeon]|nr:hypothetical protein [Candidatus Altiarchaeota archaeon]
MEKIKTGVEGLDDMLLGGLIPARSYLVVGGPGAGKTIFCIQFLMQGIKENKRCLYVALEEQADSLKVDMAELGWDISRIKILDTMQDISQGLWTLKTPGSIQKPPFSLKSLVESLKVIVTQYKPERMVIDSLTSVKMLYDSQQESRRELLGFINFLEKTGATTLLTSEFTSGSETVMEEFLSSGVIKLHLLDKDGERINAISIGKIRGSTFDKHMRPLKISENGIVVFPNESVFG